MLHRTILALLLLTPMACNQTNEPPNEAQEPDVTTFGDDVAFLMEHGDVEILSDSSGQAQVVLSAQMQGRVLTSTAAGGEGLSFGWINRPVIASGERQDHINVFGGEDRFWLGPEGGQYSIYFQPGDPFDLEHWQVPAPIDWEPYAVIEQEQQRIRYQHDMQLLNYAGTTLQLNVDRVVQLLSLEAVSDHLAMSLDAGLQLVAFESVNTVTNTGEAAWTKETGLLSVWILGMYNPSPATTVVIPYQAGSEDSLGQIVNAAYFGEVPADRLVIDDEVIYFRGDGLYRSKLGLSKGRSMPTFGSYDAANKVLTLVQYSMPDGPADYVNSMWEIQDDPYAGDVINSYNDGPPGPGQDPLGPFYELETSSPAMALAPGESFTHVHRTIHLQGPDDALSAVARSALGKSLQEIQEAFGQ